MRIPFGVRFYRKTALNADALVDTNRVFSYCQDKRLRAACCDVGERLLQGDVFCFGVEFLVLARFLGWREVIRSLEYKNDESR